MTMGLVALVTWMATAGGGLYLLAIWLIEYDREFQTAARTRLPVPVISAHALLAVTGLVIWGAYLFTDSDLLAWAALAILGVVVTLGLTMAARWLRVFRATAPEPAARPAGLRPAAAAGGAAAGMLPGPSLAQARREAAQAAIMPPERNFPVPVVILHGLLAVTTVTLVAITALRKG
jgi:manganese efflux pump family protein